MTKKIVIVGAGFGGLWAARKLAARKHSHADVEVYVIDKNNYHAFLPLLYQVAAAELEEEQIAYPVRSILRAHPNVHFLMSEVTSIDFAEKRVEMAERSIEYDELILAMGSTHHFFNVPGADSHAYPLKTIEQAMALRNQILRAFEQANLATDPDERQALLTFAIVGGGPTGVEYAGALSELVHKPLRRDFPEMDLDQVRIVLVEGTARVLGMFPEKLSDYTAQRLAKMDVEVVTERFVTEVSAETITLNDGTILPTRTVVWTAGVKGQSPSAGWDVDTAGAGQVIVDDTLVVTGMPDVYAVGDIAFFEQDGKPLPMLAQVAMQQGEHAAANIMRKHAGEAETGFRYWDKGAMATIGRNAAVTQLGRYSFTGFFAWILWLTIHIAYLIGFRNRLVVLINWAWDYFFFERIARIIVNTPSTNKNSAVPAKQEGSVR